MLRPECLTVPLETCLLLEIRAKSNYHNFRFYTNTSLNYQNDIYLLVSVSQKEASTTQTKGAFSRRIESSPRCALSLFYLIPSRDHSEDHSLIPDPKRTLQRVLINCFIEALALRCLLSISSEGILVVLSLSY